MITKEKLEGFIKIATGDKKSIMYACYTDKAKKRAAKIISDYGTKESIKIVISNSNVGTVYGFEGGGSITLNALGA